MRRNLFSACLFGSLVSVVGASCSSSSGTSPPASADGGGGDGVTKGDSGSSDSGAGDDASSGSEGGSGFTLTIQNYLQWCKFSVEGGTATTDATATMTVAPN